MITKTRGLSAACVKTVLQSLFFLTLVSCARFDAEKKHLTSEEVFKPVKAEPLQLTLLDAGAEPRKELRFHAKRGNKQTLIMTIKMAVDMGVGQATRMSAIMRVDVTIKSVSANGDIIYEMVFTDGRVTYDLGVAPQGTKARRTSSNRIKGFSITGAMSSRGIVKATAMNLPPGTSPQLRQSMDPMNPRQYIVSLRQACVRLATPFW